MTLRIGDVNPKNWTDPLASIIIWNCNSERVFTPTKRLFIDIPKSQDKLQIMEPVRWIYTVTILVNLRGMALTKIMFVFQSDGRNGINKIM